MKNLALLALLGCIVSALTACNTTRGVGEDVAATGNAVERAATPTYRYQFTLQGISNFGKDLSLVYPPNSWNPLNQIGLIYNVSST